MKLSSYYYKKIIIFLSLLTNICYGEGTKQTTDDITATTSFFRDDNSAITSRQSGQIRFEDDTQLYSNTEDETDFADRKPGKPFKFEENYSVNNNDDINDDVRVTFQDDNRIEEPAKKKKRKRRRRPKFQRPPNGPGYPVNQQFPPGYIPQAEAPYQGYPFPVQPYPGYGLQGNVAGQNFRPYRRPQQSFASDALSSITRALTSIALYDDYQCVPRLLCEAAGGGNLDSSGVLQSVSGLQPLLTMLSAYNGISSSPLFVFGRAVFVGMTNKGNSKFCHDTYPKCPSDPEKLVHYLNNHNGGFFRFFNAPHLQNPQNIQQFYNQLSIPNQQQNLEHYQNNQPNLAQFNNPYPQQNYMYHPQGFGPQNPYYIPNQAGPQGYGFYNPPVNQFHQQNQMNFGYNQYPNNDILNPNLYNSYQYPPNFGSGYPNQNYRYKNNDVNKTNEIQRRIQVKPDLEFIDTNIRNTGIIHKFVFSDTKRFEIKPNKNARDKKTLKFPDNGSQTQYKAENNNRKKKTLVFPEFHNKELNNINTNTNNIDDEEIGMLYNTNINHGVFNDYSRDYNYVASHDNANENNNKNNNNVVNEEIHTVYIVRGNGDPNKPEIVHIRPGENINF